MDKKDRYNVVVVGVGAVGREMVHVLKERRFPFSNLKVFARSSRDIELNGEIYSVRETTPQEFDGIDIALFAGTEGEKGAAVQFADEAISRGAVVIDNGADFRLKEGVPLVVPEVNPEDINLHKGLIANPNCSTIQLVLAIAPLHNTYRIKRLVISTYQAASGAGGKAREALRVEAEKVLNEEDPGSFESYGYPLAFNLIPQVGSFNMEGYTTEEEKLVYETHKILHDDGIAITATAVRVPVFDGHAESVYLETEKEIKVDSVKRLLSQAKGVTLMDRTSPAKYPVPLTVAGTDSVYVGRIRKDSTRKNGLWLWVVADNIRKGAALNAVQIAEALVKGRVGISA